MFVPFAFIAPVPDITSIPPIILPAPYILAIGAFRSYGQPIYNSILKLNTSGDVDTTFNMGIGFTGTSTNIVCRTKFLSDGKLLSVGYYNQYSGSSSPSISRINPDGTLDTTFNVGTGFLNQIVYDFVEQSDGKIIVVGQFSSYSGSSVNNITRINTNGTRDTTFNVGTGFNFPAYSIALEPSGKVIVGGGFSTYSGSSAPATVRINTNGTRDATWAPPSLANSVFSLDRQSDGKILLAGSFITPGTRTLRLNESGSQDTSWTCTANSDVYYIKQTPTGKVLLLGSFTTINSFSNNRIIRTNNSGTIDTSFRIGTGIPGNPYTLGSNALIENDDSIYTSFNSTLYSGSLTNGIVKLSPSGNIDNSFNTGEGSGSGFNSSQRSGYTIGGIGITKSGSNHVIPCGNFSSYKVPTPYNGITMLTPSASISSSFNIGTGFDRLAINAVKLSEGSFIVGGTFVSYSGSLVNRIVKIKPDGTIDNTFNIGTGFNNEVYLIRAQSDDKIIVHGAFTTYSGSSVNGLVRINTNGTRDATFNGLAVNASIFDMAIQPDNKIMAVGNFTTYGGTTANRIVRINTDGSRDNTLSIGTGFNLQGECIQIQSDGKILICGLFTTYGGVTVNRIVRLDNSGSRDTTFNTGTSFNSFVPIIRLRPDGNILAMSTSATQYSGSNFTNIICIRNSGSVNTSFSNPTSFIYNNDMSGQAQSPDILAVDSNNYAYIGGRIISYNGTVSPSLIRITDTGAVDTTYFSGSLAFNGTGRGFDENSIFLML